MGGQAPVRHKGGLGRCQVVIPLQVKLTFVTVDMGSDCQSNALEVTDASKEGTLAYPGLQVYFSCLTFQRKALIVEI